MNKYEKRDIFTSKDLEATASDFSENNEYITETAGFVPLEVKLKQFEQNGQIAQFMTSDFTSNDYRDIYLNPDFDISPEDDFEDVQVKVIARNEYIEKLKKAKSNGVNEPPEAAKAGTEEPEKATQTEKAE